MQGATNGAPQAGDLAHPGLAGDLGRILQHTWTDQVLVESLELIADTVSREGGFGAASIAVSYDGVILEHVAVAGDAGAREALLGQVRPLDTLAADIELADDWDTLCFIPHERSDQEGWIPDIEPLAVPDAWRPEDYLFAPLRGADGDLLGVLSVDLPVDGRRPGPEILDRLRGYAAHAGQLVDALLQRRRLQDQLRLAQATREVVHLANAANGVDEVVAACRDAVTEAFGANGLWIRVLGDVGQGTGAIYTSTTLPAGFAERFRQVAREAAQQAWRRKTTGIVSRLQPVAKLMPQAEYDVLREELQRVGIGNLMFVPLVAGDEVLGSLALTRANGEPEWSRTEAAAAWSLSHDLGRALLDARSREREQHVLAELRELAEYRSWLISTLCHELKTPLTAVVGHLELLEDRAAEENAAEGSGSGTEQSLAAMRRATGRLDVLIEDLQRLSRVTDPRRPLHPGPVPVETLVGEALELVASEAERREVRVLADPLPDVAVRGNQPELIRMLTNLVTNAVKYSRPGGETRISAEVADGTVEIAVADDGIGIAEAHLPRLFTEFFRSPDREVRDQPGSGLGLAIVQRIVDRHEGSIDLDSTLGQGSTFRVRLPRHDG